MKVRRYAEGTTVAVEKTRTQIEKILNDHGADAVMVFSDAVKGSRITFKMHGRMIQYDVKKPTAKELKRKNEYKDAPQSRVDAEWRRRWRALYLIVKAKLELVAAGDRSFDVEFMVDTLLPNGGTVGDRMLPQIEHAYETGQEPPLLGPGS